MKKFTKILISAVLLGCLTGVGIAILPRQLAHNDTGNADDGVEKLIRSGEQLAEDGRVFVWEDNRETGVFTLEGEGGVPPGFLEDLFKDYRYFPEDELHTLHLKGNMQFGERAYAHRNFRTIIGEPKEGFSWIRDYRNHTTTLYGEGAWPDGVVLSGDGALIVSEGITHISSQYSGAGEASKLVLSSTVQIEMSEPTYWCEFIVAEDNPYYSTYQGSLYSKDHSKLICAEDRWWGESDPHPVFHPDVTTIGSNSLRMFEYGWRSTMIIPWGVTTIEDSVFSNLGSEHTCQVIVLPDTVTFIGENNNYHEDQDKVFVFSQNNVAAKATLHEVSGTGRGCTYLDILPSVREYYPDVPESEFNNGKGENT